ncbi:MAG: ABC transporter permease [Bacillota bacterium]
MVIFRLALKNVLKNANRSLLAILGMAIAAAIMTGSISMRTGYVNPAFLDYRRFMQADVVIYPKKLHVDPGAVRQRATEEWETVKYQPTFGSDLLSLEPRLADEGFLAPPGGDPDIDLAALRQALAGRANIAGVHPLFTIPAMLSVQGEGDAVPRFYRVPVRGEDVLAAKSWGGGPPIAGGRALVPADEGSPYQSPQRFALVDARSKGHPQIPVGSQIKLYFPAVRREVAGRPVYDWSDLRAFTFTVVGHYQIPTGSSPLRTEEGLPVVDGQEGRSVIVPTYWDVPDILVPSQALAGVYGELGGTAQTRADQVGISLSSMYLAKQTAAELQQAFPNYGVYTVPNLVRLAGEGVRAIQTDSGDIRYERGRDQQMVLPADLSRTFVVLSFAIAGLLVATNMFILIAQRRQEIGILRAIGASSREVFTLILSEVIGLAVIGSLAGFLLIRLGVTFLLFFSKVSLAEAGLSTLAATAEVVGLSVLVAVLFGLLPAWEAARSTTAEVLRHE